ncbi:MAG: MFS transporter [Endomicrobia bacterium]|nr:MFS transporter [Endomicrobiia bacterium]MDW8056353.1 MFS transporter [Elusimicrobiota bacterium]
MRNVILLGLTSLLTDVSSEMVYPIIGLYLTFLGTPYTIIGIIEGIAESVANLLKVFSGQISDKLKRRKPFVIFGYSTSVLGKILLYLSSSWLGVLLARIIDRFGKGIRTAPRDALIAESTDDTKKGKIFGLHRTMDTFGATLGVIIVYILFFSSGDKIPFKQVFLWSLLPAGLAVLILFLVKEKQDRQTKSQIKKFEINFSQFKYIPLKAKLYIIISVLFALGNSSNQFLLLRAKNLGYSYLQTIALYLLYNISYTIFSYPAGIVADKVGKKTIIATGLIIYSLVYLSFALVNTSAAHILWLLFIIYGIYIGLVEGQEKAFLAEIAPQEFRASILGLHYTLVGLMLFPASFIGGILWDVIGPYATFLFSSILSLISAVMVIILI